MSVSGRDALETDRAQLVIVAAAAIALALFPMAIAYLQLGYAGDVAAEPTGTSPSEDVERALDRAVHDAAVQVDGEYAWGERDLAAEAVRDRLASDIETLETARLEEGIAVEIAYVQEHADDIAASTCPSGENREFGVCDANDGVMIQDRAGETVVLGVVFDVRVTRPDGVTELTIVVDVAG